MAAKDLHAHGSGGPTVIGNKRFDDGCEHRQHFARIGTHFFIGVVVLFFEQHGAIGLQGPASLGVGLGCEQHLANIGMHNDRISRFVFGFGSGERAHLNPVFGIHQGVLVSDFRQTQGLVSYPKTRSVHHHKHAVHALVRRAHHGANGAV